MEFQGYRVNIVPL